MATVIPNLSPADLLGRLRGPIVEAAPGYPEVIYLHVKDFERSGRLTMRFSDGSEFNVVPEPEGPDEDLSTWNLLTPDGLYLRPRPRGRWKLGLGSDVG